MTISATTLRKSFTGDGSTTAFSFDKRFLANADLKVYQEGTLKTIATHYTVTGAGNSGGGTVTFVTAPALNDEIVIINDPSNTQSLDLVANDPFPAESLEAVLDRLTLQIQRCRDLIGRSMTLSDTDTTSASVTLPAPTASYYLRWNSGGTALENVAALSSTIAVSAFSESLLDETSASAWRTAMGLGTLAIQNAASVAITGGSLTGVTITNAATLPAATETYAGAVEKATAAEARAFTAEKFLDAERLRDAFNATGSAPFYAARAWVNFNGTTAGIRASGNVSSITDNGVGDFTVNFTANMADANYACAGMAYTDTTAQTTTISQHPTTAPSASAVRISVNRSGLGAFDAIYTYVSVFR